MNENLEKALSYLEFISTDRMDEAFALTTDDCEFRMPDSRIFGREELRNLFAEGRAMFAGQFEQKIVGTTAEGDRVAIELTSRVPLKNGRTYSNEYHFAFEFRGKRIKRVAEYCDLTRTSVFRE